MQTKKIILLALIFSLFSYNLAYNQNKDGQYIKLREEITLKRNLEKKLNLEKTKSFDFYKDICKLKSEIIELKKKPDNKNFSKELKKYKNRLLNLMNQKHIIDIQLNIKKDSINLLENKIIQVENEKLALKNENKELSDSINMIIEEKAKIDKKVTELNVDLNKLSKTLNFIEYVNPQKCERINKTHEHRLIRKSLFSKNLDINLGKVNIYINKKINKYNSEIEGYLLVYIDGLLNSKFKINALKTGESFSLLDTYQINNRTLKIDKIKSKNKISLGFIDLDTFKTKFENDEPKDDIEYFLDAYKNNLFLASTLEIKCNDYDAPPILKDDNTIIISRAETIDENVNLLIYDNGHEIDTDVIDVYQNEGIIFKNLTLKSKEKSQLKSITLKKGPNIFYIKCTSVGSENGGCTSNLIFYDQKNEKILEEKISHDNSYTSIKCVMITIL